MTKYAYVENDVVQQVYDGLPQSWKNISGLDKQIGNNEYLKTLGFLPVEEIVPSYNSQLEFISGPFISIENNKVLITYQVIPHPKEKLDNQKKELLKMVREERDSLLSKSDWTLISDVVETKDDQWVDQWKTYRQALRDFPQFVEIEYQNQPLIDFYQIKWPVKPNAFN